MKPENLNNIEKKVQIYVLSCCFDDRLEDMKISFTKQKAIDTWEKFTGRDYEEYLKNQEKGIYDNSETAGTKINEFEFKLSEIINH